MRIVASRRARRRGGGGIRLRGWDQTSLGGDGRGGKALLQLGGSWPSGEEVVVVVVVVGWGSGSIWFVWWCSCRRMDTVWKMDELEGVWCDGLSRRWGGECLPYQMMVVSLRVGFEVWYSVSRGS